MYFNKKYHCTGPLFEGPYKSVQIKGVSRLLHLTRYFHKNHQENVQDLTKGFTSYPEYLGVRETSWVKPKAVLTFFHNSENAFFKGTGGYRNFVEKYQLNSNEQKMLASIIIENEAEHLEWKKPIMVKKAPAPAQEPDFEVTTESQSRLPEFTIAAIVFVLLFTFGFRNVRNSSAKTIGTAPSQAPAVAEVKDTMPEKIIESPAPSPTPVVAKEEVKPQVAGAEDVNLKKTVAIKADEGSVINIRENPTTGSKRIGKAKNDDTFELISMDTEWGEIKLNDGSIGFVSAEYLEIVEGTNN